jgi:hypothetical protein
MHKHTHTHKHLEALAFTYSHVDTHTHTHTHTKHTQTHKTRLEALAAVVAFTYSHVDCVDLYAIDVLIGAVGNSASSMHGGEIWGGGDEGEGVRWIGPGLKHILSSFAAVTLALIIYIYIYLC